jgi:hypothetical protein
MRSSGQMMVVMMEAGTTIPPMPRPARIRRPQRVCKLKRLAQARAPQPGRGELVVKITAIGKRGLTSCHQDRRDDHQLFISTSEHRQTPENDTSTSENGESNGDTADPDTDWVMAIDIKGLSGPEHDDGEEVGS